MGVIRRSLEEAKLIARTSDRDWLGEELYRLQEQSARLIARVDELEAELAERRQLAMERPQ